MADTVRTIAQILALLADNTSGDISAQDVRDLVVSLQPGHGEISVTSSAATTVSDTTSFFEAAGTYALSGNAHNWDMNTSAQLRYTGTPDRVCHIAASFSLTASGSNKVLYVTVTKNGSEIVPSTLHRKIGVGTDVGAGAAHAFVSMSTNDYLSVAVRNTTSATNVTFETLNLFAMSMAAQS